MRHHKFLTFPFIFIPTLHEEAFRNDRMDGGPLLVIGRHAKKKSTKCLLRDDRSATLQAACTPIYVPSLM